jgi:cell division protein FtsL
MDEGRGLSLRELVLEVRADVKALDEKIEKIDRHGSIGTREDLTDHESRIRRVEKWMYGVPLAAAVSLASIVAALRPHL